MSWLNERLVLPSESNGSILMEGLGGATLTNIGYSLSFCLFSIAALRIAGSVPGNTNPIEELWKPPFSSLIAVSIFSFISFSSENLAIFSSVESSTEDGSGLFFAIASASSLRIWI